MIALTVQYEGKAFSEGSGGDAGRALAYAPRIQLFESPNARGHREHRGHFH